MPRRPTLNEIRLQNIMEDLDDELRDLVVVVDSFPGISTSWCGSGDEACEQMGLLNADAFCVDFSVSRTKAGWRSLEILSCGTVTFVDIDENGRPESWKYNVHTWMEVTNPPEHLHFSLRCHDLDPGDVAEYLAELLAKHATLPKKPRSKR